MNKNMNENKRINKRNKLLKLINQKKIQKKHPPHLQKSPRVFADSRALGRGMCTPGRSERIVRVDRIQRISGTSSNNCWI